MRTCTRCGETKDEAGFYSAPWAARVGKCRDCVNEVKRAYRKENHQAFKPEWSRAARLRRRGLDGDGKRAMWLAQGGKCALCRDDLQPNTAERMNLSMIDHDHATGRVRAILCRPCNLGLGQFRDNPDLMRAAAAYVESYRLEVVNG